MSRFRNRKTFSRSGISLAGDCPEELKMKRAERMNPPFMHVATRR